MSEDSLIAIVSVSVVFGAPLVWFIVDTLATNWRKVRISEQGVLLKREMIERGYTAEEIIQVLEAGADRSELKKQRPAAVR